MALTKVTRDLLNTGIDDNSTSTAITIDSSQNVALGTDSPNSYSGYTTLTLDHATNGSLIDFELNGTLVGEVYTQDANTFAQQAVGARALAFRTNSTERLRIGSAGQIGLSGANYGTSGQVLTSNGGSSAPTWQDASGGGNIDGTTINPSAVQIGGTTVIDSSRNLTNMGTGAFSGNIQTVYTGNSSNDSGVYVNNDASDWGIKITKVNSDNYGMLIESSGTYAFAMRDSGNVYRVRFTGTGDGVFGGTVTADRFYSGVGTAASPAFQVGDTNTGFYDSGSNRIAVACNGAAEFDFGASRLDMLQNRLDNVSEIRIVDANTKLIEGSGNAVRIQTNSGYVDVGAQNTTYTHFQTDRPNFYFDKPIHADGQIYNYVGGTTSDPYWRAGNDGSGSGLDADTVDGVEASIIMNKGADLPSGVNLNNYTTIGFYHQNSNSNASSGSNYPVAQAGMLTVTADGLMVYQTYHRYNGNHYYHRSYYNGTWYPWRLVWTNGNDGSGSGLDADLLDGYNSAENGGSTIHRLASNGYSQLQNWTNVADAGLYSTTTNGAHFYPNTVGSYGTWRINGSRGSYTGIYLNDGGGVVLGMYDGNGNGGAWSSSSSWHFYYHKGNDCIGLASSSTSSSYGAYVSGALYATGNITAYSDRRIKENIITLDSALDKVNALRGVYYNKIDDPEKTKQIGFIAQEVNEVVPELVTYAEDVDEYGVNYGNATALLVEAVKDLTQQVNDLKAEIEELKNA